MTDHDKHNLLGVKCDSELADGTERPVDSNCPVTKYREDFVPSRLIDEAKTGWFPKLIRHCIGCELCSPTTNASFPECADTCISAVGKQEEFSPMAFGGALDAIVSIQIKQESRQNRLEWIDESLHVADENEKCDVGLFVGDSPYLDILLGDEIGFKPTEEFRAAIDLLNSVGIHPVVLPDEVDAGGDRFHAGDMEAFIILGNRNRDMFKSRGVKTIVTTCDDCYYTLRFRYPRYIDDWDFKVMRLVDFLVEHGGKLTFLSAKETVAIQSPDLYTDHDGLDSVRKLLKSIPGLTVKEIEGGHPSTFGGWGQFDSVTKRLETDFLKAADRTGAVTVLIPSTRMLVRLLEGRRPGSWEETSIEIKGLYGFLSGKHTVHEEFAGA
ncbi:(Fe-S)-binding protein [bacterium]|nr:(Fe-S)-binding protein [bacterium]